MVIFEHKSSDKIILRENDKTTVEVTTYEKVFDDTIVINIPSLNIHINTKKKDEVDDLIHVTLTSFFRFWKVSQGMAKLYEHMLALGFSIRSDENSIPLDPNLQGKRIIDELEVA